MGGINVRKFYFVDFTVRSDVYFSVVRFTASHFDGCSRLDGVNVSPRMENLQRQRFDNRG